MGGCIGVETFGGTQVARRRRFGFHRFYSSGAVISYRFVKVKQNQTHPHMTNFSLSVCGLVFDGFTYIPEHDGKKSIVLSPRGQNGRRLVSGFGIHWKRLKDNFETYLKEETTNNA